MDTKQSPTNLRFSFGVVNCLVVFPTHFNQNNSLLIILQISLLFMCIPALRKQWNAMISSDYIEYDRGANDENFLDELSLL